MLKQEGYPELASSSSTVAKQWRKSENPLFHRMHAMCVESGEGAVLFVDIRDGSVQLEDPPQTKRVLGGVHHIPA
jgi:hypothetical protein